MRKNAVVFRRGNYGGITDLEELKSNLKQNCIPEKFEQMDIGSYEQFLNRRRELMAEKIRDYYWNL